MPRTVRAEPNPVPIRRRSHPRPDERPTPRALHGALPPTPRRLAQVASQRCLRADERPEPHPLAAGGGSCLADDLIRDDLAAIVLHDPFVLRSIPPPVPLERRILCLPATHRRARFRVHEPLRARPVPRRLELGARHPAQSHLGGGAWRGRKHGTRTLPAPARIVEQDHEPSIGASGSSEQRRTWLLIVPSACSLVNADTTNPHVHVRLTPPSA